MKRRAWGTTLLRPTLWLGMALGAGFMWVACELPYANWHGIVSPLERARLVIRQDAKGDGHFMAPRSGHRRHRGIDLVAEMQTPVHAIRSGTVVEIGAHRGLGRFVDIEHGHHVHSLYAHLQDVLVEPGARVRQGALIGTVGKTGNARHRWITPHLHLEVVRNGEPIDPQSLGLTVIEPLEANHTPAAADSRAEGGE